MQLNVSPLLGIIALFLTTGCAGYRTVANAPEMRPLGKAYKTLQAGSETSIEGRPAEQVKEPTGTVTLGQALSLALLRNPELAAFSWEVRAREARALQASRLPNPELGVEMENFGGSGDFSGSKQTETTILLSHVVELGGKRRKRTRVAALASDLAAWDFEVKRMDVLTNAKQAFLDVQFMQSQLELNKELVRLAGEFVAVVSQRVRAGKTSPAEESRARVALSNARIKLDRSRRDLEVARRRLAATWDSSSPAFLRAAGEIDTTLTMFEFEPLLAALSQNPEVARWAVAMEQHSAALSLAQAMAIPDLSIGGGLRRLNEGDANAFVVAVSLPIPIFDRNQGAKEEVRSRIQKAAWQRRATRRRITTLMAEVHQRMSAAFDESTMLRRTVLPEAQKAYDTINQGYRRGKFGILEVLDAQRTLFDARSQYLLSLTEFHKAKADLERLVGQRLETVQ